MIIAHLIYSLDTGGSETLLVDIANEQVNQAEVKIVIINKIYNETLLNKIDERVKVYFINRTENSRSPYPVIILNLLLWKLAVDVLHCHNHNIIPLILPFLRKKAVLTLHCLGIPSKYLDKYHQLFAISESVKKDVVFRTKINPILVYNGIPTKTILIKEKYSIKNVFKIICVGRLDHNIKGQHIAIAAVNILNEMRELNIHLDIIGTGSSEEFLKALCSKYGLTEQISFLGLKNREYIYSHLKDYDLLIQPSLIEGFGLTVAEGMAANIPVLVSNIDGPMEIIENGKFGFHFQTGNAENMAEQIKNISNYSSDKLTAITKAAYSHVVENFDIKATAISYIKNYHST